MLAIRTLEGLGLRGNVLTSAANPVLPYWMETLSVEASPAAGAKLVWLRKAMMRGY